MDSTSRRMISVAVVVCAFAVGMAGLLNFFKYRSTASRLVTDRLVVTGKSVENAIQSSLALGLQFSDIGTLPGTLEREQATDNLIAGIDIFDTEGRLLYSTDRLRAARPVPAAWLAAARKAGNHDWLVNDGDEAAAGMAVNNNFGLVIGHLAIRFSPDRVRDAELAVGREIALASFGVFVLAALLSSLALLAVMRRLEADVRKVEAALRAGDLARASTLAARGPFGPSMQRFLKTTRLAEAQIARLRARLPVTAAGATVPGPPTATRRPETPTLPTDLATPATPSLPAVPAIPAPPAPAEPQSRRAAPSLEPAR
jgi:hypothetical protein